MSQPGYVGLEGEPWVQRSWVGRKPEWTEGAGEFRGHVPQECQRSLEGPGSGGVSELLGAGLGGIICPRQEDILGVVTCPRVDIIGVGHSGDRIRGQRYNLTLSLTRGGHAFLTGTQMPHGSDTGGGVRYWDHVFRG